VSGRINEKVRQDVRLEVLMAATMKNVLSHGLVSQKVTDVSDMLSASIFRYVPSNGWYNVVKYMKKHNQRVPQLVQESVISDFQEKCNVRPAACISMYRHNAREDSPPWRQSLWSQVVYYRQTDRQAGKRMISYSQWTESPHATQWSNSFYRRNSFFCRKLLFPLCIIYYK
jgi:hypothetical protein